MPTNKFLCDKMRKVNSQNTLNVLCRSLSRDAIFLCGFSIFLCGFSTYVKFRAGICKEKVSVVSVPFVDTCGCSIRKYVDL